MDHFLDEPSDSIILKKIMSVVAAIEVIIFIGVYELASFGPGISQFTDALILAHLGHLIMFMATIVFSGATVKPVYATIYLGAFFIVLVADAFGAITRTVFILECSSCDIGQIVVGKIELAFEYVLILLCVLQICLAVATIRVAENHAIVVNFLVAYLANIAKLPGSDKLLAKALDELNMIPKGDIKKKTIDRRPGMSSTTSSKKPQSGSRSPGTFVDRMGIRKRDHMQDTDEKKSVETPTTSDPESS